MSQVSPEKISIPRRISGKKIPLKRLFTKEGVHPFDEVKWKTVKTTVRSMNGTHMEERELEFPDFWSENATSIAGSKYFRGRIGSPERETSVRQMISRVANTICEWGLLWGYFDTQEDAAVFCDELTHILLHQKAAFNSPVWFNVGVDEKAQCPACFILSVEDNMESILDWIYTEGMIFKKGSGAGINLSPLRSALETLSKGGHSSGPVSFMRGADSVAGMIASGGSTRRAAKMVVLNVDHPDIMKFIRCKAEEEKKIRAFIEAGYNMYDLNNHAWNSIQYQNANNSVRVTDEFMEAVEEDGPWQTHLIQSGEAAEEYRARDLMREIAQAAWESGDPGMQHDTTINRWHTVPSSGRINASNPCSEYMSLDNSSCNLASINLLKFLNPDGTFAVKEYMYTIDVMILAQEIIVSGSSYPTEKIAEVTRAHRQLGLGYANLGALLMTLGMPYDSDAARHSAGALTALLSSEGYRYSAEIAKRTGPYDAFRANREPQLKVIAMHGDALERVRKDRVFDREIYDAAKKAWQDAFVLGKKYGIRNSQISVIAPTGCLVGKSLVSTNRGLVRLNTLGNPDGTKWQDADFKVLTDKGSQEATKFYINGVAATRKIKTENGYEIQGTPEHRIKVVDPTTGSFVWRRFGEISTGDIVPLSMGKIIGEPQPVKLPPLGDLYWASNYSIRTPSIVTPELATLVGYFMGDGSLHAKGLRFCVSHEDEDVVRRLQILIKRVFNLETAVTAREGYWEVAVNSVHLAIWWDACGFSKKSPNLGHGGKGYHPHIPDAILYTNNPEVYRSFIRGLFEADGTITGGVPVWATVNLEFYQDVKTLLLALGFPTSSKLDNGGGRFGKNDLLVLRLKNNTYNTKFLRGVGTLGLRKRVAIAIANSSQSGKRDPIYVSGAYVQDLIPLGEKSHHPALLSLRRDRYISRSRIEAMYEITKDAYLEEALGYFYDRVSVNEDGGEALTYDLSVPTNVTYVANGFISHNTIALMMDCATTGVEPEFALVKIKQLVGGGTMKFVNTAVPEALRRLGYNEEEMVAIADYLEGQGTIEGAPGLKAEHLPVFDCAVKPANGKRAISWQGHVKMVAAVQPFISGAISKTFNMPNETTVEEIMKAYIMGWKLGLKAFAVYRDGSKAAQPLTTSTGQGGKREEKPTAYRRRLPATRPSETHKFSIAGHEGFFTYSTFDNGDCAELFIRMSKQGSTLAGLLDAFAITVSIALQHGVPLKTLVRKFAYTRFEPAGYTENPAIQVATSITDYIFRYLAFRFLSQDNLDELGIKAPPKEVEALTRAVESGAVQKELPLANGLNGSKSVVYADSVCRECGGMMVQTGSCKTCFQCGATSGGC